MPDTSPHHAGGPLPPVSLVLLTVAIVIGSLGIAGWGVLRFIMWAAARL